jgi:hypothetical protein
MQKNRRTEIYIRKSGEAEASTAQPAGAAEAAPAPEAPEAAPAP